MDRSRDQLGRYGSSFDADEVLTVFRNRSDQARPLTASDVAEEIDCSERTAHNKLWELEEREKIATRKAGPGRVWWVPLPRESAPLSVMGITSTELPQNVEEVLELTNGTIPGRTGETKRERAEAVLTAYRYLQEQGRASNEELRTHTYEQHPLESGTANQTPAEQQWVLFIRDGLRELPGVESPPRSASIWNFIEPGGELAQRLDQDIDEWIYEEVDVAGSGTNGDHQRALVQIAYDHLKVHKKAGREEFKEALPSGYTAHYSDFNGLWTYLLQESLKEAPDVEYERGQRGGIYTYVGE